LCVQLRLSVFVGIRVLPTPFYFVFEVLPFLLPNRPISWISLLIFGVPCIRSTSYSTEWF